MNKKTKSKVDLSKIIEELRLFSEIDIEIGLVNYLYPIHDREFSNLINSLFEYEEINSTDVLEVIDIFRSYNFSYDIEVIIDFFERILKTKNTQSGVVFTPKYISDYIVFDNLESLKDISDTTRILDPACGCGVFLISAIDILNRNYGFEVSHIVNNMIFGIDLIEENVRRSKILIFLYCKSLGINLEDISANIKQANSLSVNWFDLFDNIEHQTGFDLIVGNPPYYNTHDMSESEADFLRENFNTTKSGTFNIFYAFVETSIKFLSQGGRLGFIIPNNFLTISSAIPFRKFLSDNKLVNKIIDFSDNMIFHPIRTYSAIISLTKQDNHIFKYHTISKTNDISGELINISFKVASHYQLDPSGWFLIDQTTRHNIKRIESQIYSIKGSIRTGIATLKDSLYIVERRDGKFYSRFSNHFIEEDVVKKLFKIPEIFKHKNINQSSWNIIFPYEETNKGFEIIPEREFLLKYPSAYEYFCSIKHELILRDKGNLNIPVWYAYGRSQGLNKFGEKILYTTFSPTPRFVFVDDRDSLFCNGYAIFEVKDVPFNVLLKILNSVVMDYYVKNTSYTIDGGYYCYQKKYIEKFSIPFLSELEKELILTSSKSEVDSFLIKKYDLDFDEF